MTSSDIQFLGRSFDRMIDRENKQDQIIVDLRQMIIHLQAKVEHLDGSNKQRCNEILALNRRIDELEKAIGQYGRDGEEEEQEEMNKEVAMHFIGVIRHELCKLAQYIES